MRRVLPSLLALFMACAPAFAQAPVIGQGGAAPGPPLVYRDGFVIAGGGAPFKSLSAGCGSGSVAAGNFTAGWIFLDNATSVCGTTCDITFASGFDGNLYVPVCILSAQEATSALAATPPVPAYAITGPPTGNIYSILRLKATLTGNTYLVWFCFGTQA
jgi:uncharacterized integral membrane protein